MPIRNFINADTVDGFHASPTPRPNTIPVAGSDGKLVSGWFPDVGLNADTVDGFHASQTPSPNTIPVAGSDGKLASGWFPDVGLNADTVDGFHASSTPRPNAIPVASADGKIALEWLLPLVSTVSVFSPSANTIYQETTTTIIMVVAQDVYGIEISPDGSTWIGKFGQEHYYSAVEGGTITFVVPKMWFWRFSGISHSTNGGFSPGLWVKIRLNY